MIERADKRSLETVPEPTSSISLSPSTPDLNRSSVVGSRYLQHRLPDGSAASRYACLSDLDTPYSYQLHNVPHFGIPAPSWKQLSPGIMTSDHAPVSRVPSCGNLIAGTYRNSPRITGRRDNDYLSGHHNVVDVERIRQGLDVRTTVSYAPLTASYTASD